MVSYKLFSRITIASASAILLGCDGGTPETASDRLDSMEVVRGLDLFEITNNPGGTPGFPFSIGPGDTLTFTPVTTEAGGFLENVPLGVWDGESANFMRQRSAETGDLYYPIGENSFRYFYSTPTNADPTTVSNQQTANLSYTFEHRFDRITEYIPRMTAIAGSTQEPGSFGFSVLPGQVVLVSDQERLQVETHSSIGIASVQHPLSPLGTTSVRRARLITLSDISSTNADLQGDNPIITGTYTITDTWHDTIALGLNLLFDPITQADITYTESEAGTFVLELNGLNQPR